MDQNIDHLDNIYGAILCDSYYVFRGLARGVSVVNFVLWRASHPASQPASLIHSCNGQNATFR